MTKIATVPDHIIPLSQGGTDDDQNIQCLCHDCHAIKTASDGNQHGAANHPEWLEASSIPLVIVSGPPASGKTTYVQDRAGPTDVVIDLDSIMRSLNPRYSHWAGALDQSLFDRAVRTRNAMLASLARATGGKAWFIVSAPTAEERNWWLSKLGGELVLLHPGVAECKRRAEDRGTPQAVAGIVRWDKQSRLPWKRSGGARKAAKGCNPDGTPLDPSHPWGRNG